ncbi:type II/IV secretion system ATPase subunit [Pyrobaculum arsenaticum]|uniref:Type II secretion system protein E n=2 Tax=Pyrobaculum arsenaticum TaxID=121277 RepID=A4WMR2_PYRAR|nr:type II/IV secretion system ATPase subunit [Pyrobaculum arsenaticum]ABP51679.1 type II secretion system protein E [Pyrobaculum arsenaticum DSM 13514]NYR15998.1 type II/IV secretion system ATPase subunit [Pyrobaculum arsenaticum]
MLRLLTRLLECAECKRSCKEKGVCDFTEEETTLLISLLSRIYKKTIDETLDFRYDVLRKINQNTAVHATLATVGLEQLAEFLEDDDVEDVVLIPGRPIYITRRYGKEKIGKISEAKTLRALLKIAHLKGVELTTANPSFRYGLSFGGYRLRVSIDLPPIVPHPQAYVRVHRKKITAKDLVKSGFLTGEQLREIVAWLREGRHVVVSGPPGSGKTTLLAAIDDLIPPHLQRVYIDEADEFEDDPNKNQIKIRSVNKAKEVLASLNRNIDVIFIGELQYEDHFAAFRTASEMGLQTLATMHATNVEDAQKRLKRRGIELQNIGIVQLSKKYGAMVERKVAALYAK